MAPSILTKNDIKHIHTLEPPFCFEDQETEDLYNIYKNLLPIEYRIYDAIEQEYYYLDLSNMSLTDEYLEEIFKDSRIIEIMKNAEIIDLSYNNLTYFPEGILSYKNIQNIDLSNNFLVCDIDIKNIIELDLSNNKLTDVQADNISRLYIDGNFIQNINLSNIQHLDCCNNCLTFIPYIESLNILVTSCANISDLYEIKDIDVFNNNYYVILKNNNN